MESIISNTFGVHHGHFPMNPESGIPIDQFGHFHLPNTIDNHYHHLPLDNHFHHPTIGGDNHDFIPHHDINHHGIVPTDPKHPLFYANQSKMMAKATAPTNDFTLGANDHGFNTNVSVNHNTDSGHVTVTGSGTGDWHGHNTVGGGVTYTDNHGWSVGGNYNVGPNGSHNYGGQVSWKW